MAGARDMDRLREVAAILARGYWRLQTAHRVEGRARTHRPQRLRPSHQLAVSTRDSQPSSAGRDLDARGGP